MNQEWIKKCGETQLRYCDTSHTSNLCVRILFTSHSILCFEFFLSAPFCWAPDIYLYKLLFLHLPISVFKELFLFIFLLYLVLDLVSLSTRLQAVQCCSLYWLGILKAHVWTRKPNLIPGLPLRVEDVKPTGYVVSWRKREDAQKDVGGDRRWRNCQWYREILLDAGSKPAEIYTSLF